MRWPWRKPGPEPDPLTEIEQAHDAEQMDLARILSAAVFVPDRCPHCQGPLVHDSFFGSVSCGWFGARHLFRWGSR